MGKSAKQKGNAIKQARAKRRLRVARTGVSRRWAFQTGLMDGTIIPVNKAKVFSRSVLPKVPDYYRDRPFSCKLCGKTEVWTAKQQQRWHEEQGGEIEAVAIHCHACRRELRTRKAAARRVHLEGLERKRVAQTGKSVKRPQRGQT
jgi:Probable zinc-ribbon domain